MIEKLKPGNLLLGIFRCEPIKDAKENDRSYVSKIHVIYVESVDILNKIAYCSVIILSRERMQEEIDSIWSKVLSETFKKEVKTEIYSEGGVIEWFDSLLFVEENGIENEIFCDIRSKNSKSAWEYLEQRYPIGIGEVIPK